MSDDVSKGRSGIIVTAYCCGVNESYQTRQTADYLFIINFCPVDVEKIRFGHGFSKKYSKKKKKSCPRQIHSLQRRMQHCYRRKVRLSLYDDLSISKIPGSSAKMS